MKIFLGNPPWRKDNRLGVRAGSRWPFTLAADKNNYLSYIPFPFFLSSATALLKKHNKNVLIVDAIAEGIDEREFIERIKNFGPDLIVFETSTPSIENDLMIANKTKSELRKSTQIVLTGSHVSVFPEEILKEYPFIDYILIGEYEYSLLELVNFLENNRDLDKVLSLVYRRRDTIKINPLRTTIGDLDSLPWPEREMLPVYRYNDGFADLPQPNVQMWASRGCPFQCIFCLWPQVIYREHKHRKRNPEDVVDEMEWLIKKYKFKAVYFDDDVFNIDRDYVMAICKEIKKRKVDIPWAIMARADLMDAELLETMASSGLYAIKYGIESANEDVLRNSRKNMDLNKAKEIIKTTKDIGIKVHLTFVFGLPGETKKSIQESLSFLETTRPHSVQFSIATPFPGTEFFAYMENNRCLLSKDWSDYDGSYKSVIKTEELSSKELENAVIKARDFWDNIIGSD